MRNVSLLFIRAAFRITRSVWRVDIHNRVARTSANNRELCRSGDKIAAGGFPFRAAERRIGERAGRTKSSTGKKAIAFHRRPTFVLLHLPPAGRRRVNREISGVN